MLAHGYWERRFGSDRGVLGRTLLVNGVSREIIGVLPESLRFIRGAPDVYMPFQFDRSELYVGNFSYQAVARLAPELPSPSSRESANMWVSRFRLRLPARNR